MTQHRPRRALHAASMAAGVAAALAVAAVLRGDGLGRSTPPPPPGYVVARADGYTLYAPSRPALVDGIREIEGARRAFRDGFGAEPGQVVVVLADSPAAFRAMDLAPLRRPGAGFVPFVTRAHVASSGDDDLLALDGGTLLKQVNGTAQVVAPGGGAALRAGLRERDEVVRVNGISAARLDSLAPRFAAIPHGGRVRLELRRDGAPLRIEYSKGAVVPNAAAAYARAAARFRAQGNTLAHEVCHQFVARLADDAGSRRTAARAGYGHDALPDWFDEMAATMCESPAARRQRRDYLRSSLDERIPLATLARMDHPVSAAVAVRSRTSAPASTEGLPVQVLRGEAARELLRNMNAPLFYAQSLSLGEFLAQRGGPATLRNLTQSLARGRTLDEALRLAHRRAPSLPSSVEALETEWLRWLTAGDLS